MKNSAAALNDALAAIPEFAPVIGEPLVAPDAVHLDFSTNNPSVRALDIQDTAGLGAFVEAEMRRAHARIGVGGYNEKRGWYARSAVFAGEEVRSIHLGVDIWAAPGTKIFSPLSAHVHSFKDNAQFGDYGPTIILQHQANGITFFTLYGHLTRDSLQGIEAAGARISAGQEIAAIGAPPTNGDWPPHLHFQLILDMGDYAGDFPGVAAESKRAEFLARCPDPNLILRSPLLAML